MPVGILDFALLVSRGEGYHAIPSRAKEEEDTVGICFLLVSDTRLEFPTHLGCVSLCEFVVPLDILQIIVLVVDELAVSLLREHLVFHVLHLYPSVYLHSIKGFG